MARGAHRRIRRVAVALSAAVFVAACSDGRATVVQLAPASSAAPAASVATTIASSTTSSTAPATSAPATTSTTPTTAAAPVDPPPPVATLAPLQLSTQTLAVLEYPNGMANRPGDPGLYIIGQLGQVWYMVDGQVRPDLVLDLRGRTSVLQAASSETGLLGIAFSPVDDRMYLNYTNANNDTIVAAWAVKDGRADPASELPILVQSQPGLGHKGGGLAFDRAGNLFVGLGDGGGSNGRDARDMTQLLGKISRITPTPNGSAYTIPADNPFASRTDVRPEIYAYGMRNPWRLSYDAPTGDVWFGDVGNKTREEIDRIPAGQAGGDYGWYYVEGTAVRVQGGPPDTIPPVFEWRHPQDGVAAMGGYVYRGQATPALRGSYVFGDITGVVWLLGADGVVRHDLDGFGGLVSFGVDNAGELYVISVYGDVARLNVA